MPTSTKVKLSTLSYVILYVKNIESAKKFYSETLGMKIKVDAPDWVELDTGAATVALHTIESSPSKPEKGNPELVFAVDNVYDAYDELKKAGVKFNHEPHQVCEQDDSVGVSVSLLDEDGNTISIYSDVAKDKVRK